MARLILIFALVFAGSANAADYRDIVSSVFRNGVVKIDVASRDPVIRNSVNICNNEGTGFVVSAAYIATAKHVVETNPACGTPIIILKAPQHQVVVQARIIGFRDDVALLKIDGEFPPPMCALALKKDVYNTEVFRIGVPKGFENPSVRFLRVNARDPQFEPLVLLSDAATEGESGAPIVHEFNVVGVTKARHRDLPNVSFMTIGSKLLSLMAEHRIARVGNVCNPTEWETLSTFPLGPRLVPHGGLSPEAKPVVGRQTEAVNSIVKMPWDLGMVRPAYASDQPSSEEICLLIGAKKGCEVNLMSVRSDAKKRAVLQNAAQQNLWRALVVQAANAPENLKNPIAEVDREQIPPELRRPLNHDRGG